MTETVARLGGAVRKLKDGFGFIAADDGQDYFFHWTAMDIGETDFRALALRQRVSFEITRSDRGARAIKVRTDAESRGAQAEEAGQEKAS